MVDKAKRIAAHMLEASEDDVEFANGTFSVKGAPGTGKTIQDLAFAAFAAHDMPDGVEPNLDADATFDPVALSFPHGTHLCAVDVDTETGRATIRRYVCVDDVGEVINPLIVDGQVHGGVVQGISQALFEEAVYDADGNLTTGSFVDYLLPSAADVPSFDHRPHGEPVDDESAGREGRRRDRDDRRNAGRRQRNPRRGAPIRCR